MLCPGGRTKESSMTETSTRKLMSASLKLKRTNPSLRSNQRKCCRNEKMNQKTRVFSEMLAAIDL